LTGVPEVLKPTIRAKIISGVKEGRIGMTCRIGNRDIQVRGKLIDRRRVIVVDGEPVLTNAPVLDVPRDVARNILVLMQLTEDRKDVTHWGVIPRHGWYGRVQTYLNGEMKASSGNGTIITQGKFTGIDFSDGKIVVKLLLVGELYPDATEDTASTRLLTYPAEQADYQPPAGGVVAEPNPLTVKIQLSHSYVQLDFYKP
jgi:hypothetical protein